MFALSLLLPLLLTPKLKRFRSFSGMIPESLWKRFRNITTVELNEKKRSFNELCIKIIVNVQN